MPVEPALTVMHQPASAPHRRLDAEEGASLVLASCRCAHCDPDLELACWPWVWVRCVITAYEDHWRLANLCLDVEVVVVDLENPELRISATPGRRQMVVPFEFSGISFRIGPCEASTQVTVIGPEVVVEDPPVCRSSQVDPPSLGPQAGTICSAVLEELCSSARRTGIPPSSAAVAAQLSRRGLRITARSVDHHIDYLFRRLVPDFDSHPVRGYKRWALVSMMRRRSATSTSSENSSIGSGSPNSPTRAAGP